MRIRKYFNKNSLTKQSFKDECDVNMIMKKFKKICGADYLSVFQSLQGGSFADFSNVKTLQEAMALMDDVCKVFEALPAKVRAFFENSPEAFASFVNDPSNDAKGVEIGLYEAPRVVVSSDVVGADNEGVCPQA